MSQGREKRPPAPWQDSVAVLWDVPRSQGDASWDPAARFPAWAKKPVLPRDRGRGWDL